MQQINKQETESQEIADQSKKDKQEKNRYKSPGERAMITKEKEVQRSEFKMKQEALASKRRELSKDAIYFEEGLDGDPTQLALTELYIRSKGNRGKERRHLIYSAKIFSWELHALSKQQRAIVQIFHMVLNDLGPSHEVVKKYKESLMKMGILERSKEEAATSEESKATEETQEEAKKTNSEGTK